MSVSIFGNLDEAGLKSLIPGGSVRGFPKHAVIINEGDATDTFYIVLSGRAKVYVRGDEGKEVVVNSIGPGEYFGELSLDGGVRSASVMATEPCRCFMVARGDIEILLTQYPLFALDVIKKLIANVRRLTNTVRDLALRDVYGRLVVFIEKGAVEIDGVLQFAQPLTQRDIAQRIGGSREMVSRILRQLSDGGYITVVAKKILIHKKLPARW